MDNEKVLMTECDSDSFLGKVKKRDVNKEKEDFYEWDNYEPEERKGFSI